MTKFKLFFFAIFNPKISTFKLTIPNKIIKQNFAFDVGFKRIHLDKCFLSEADLDFLGEGAHSSVLALEDEDLKDVVREDVEDDEKNGL